MADEWEYQTEVLKPDDMALRLNELAHVGWELVSLAPCEMLRSLSNWTLSTTQYLAVFKRRKP
ncbi:MAG TPA: hypothetical protein VFS83_02890 [Ktedonobacterales bacterium]|nr:hypothetical protein [Ktedonobacterales bacterium]